jgi:hypothetical protein
MSPWVPLIGLSVLAGVGSALLVNGRKAILLGAALPWLGTLAWLLYNEYFVPYQGGGASMWPIALLFAGSITAGVGAAAAGVTNRVRRRGPQ